jgi:hypothetical protein
MHSQKSPVITATPPRGKQHSYSSSLGSLYEVLADLDETQLQYLVQEVNHTGHVNLSVSEALSTFEGQRSSQSLDTTTRANMLSSTQVPQRQPSKSQKGKLRLQTALQRANSSRRGRFPENEDTDRPMYSARQGSKQELTNDGPHDSIHAGVVKTSNYYPSPARETENYLLKPNIKPEIEADTIGNSPQNNRTSSQRKSPSYKRIPRPDFHLPTGITLADLLQLLEVEFLSSSSQLSSPVTPLSLSGESPTHSLSAPSLLSPVPPISFRNTPRSGALRRVSSRLDLALEAERTVSGAQEIGLGMLEPRQPTPALRDEPAFGAPVTPVMYFDHHLKGEKTPHTTPAVLEGIFDVLENY